MLSSEQGVYVAESVATKNVRLAKGRFRVYGDDDGFVSILLPSKNAWFSCTT